MQLRRVLGCVAAIGCLSILPTYAQAAISQPAPVKTNAADQIPQLWVDPGNPSATKKPHVDGIAVLGSTAVAGGLFQNVLLKDGSHPAAKNLFAFDTGTGLLSWTTPTGLNFGAKGQVYSVATDGVGSMYVGGSFTWVDSGGAQHGGLVKLNAATGAIDQTFKPYFKTGTVNDLEYVPSLAGQPRLIVGGGQGKYLASVNPTTGKNDNYINLTIADVVHDSDGNVNRGGVAVFQLAVSPDRTKLIATGNFMHVNGANRRGFFMLDLPASGSATLNNWYYPHFADDCTSTTIRRIAYLQGVDWSPDGQYLDVTATGQTPERTGDAPTSQVWHSWDTTANNADSTVCDAVARFRLSDQNNAVWMNYTGGDSIWTVQDTGSAIYVQGHYKFLDNPDGFASWPARWDSKPGTTCSTAGVKPPALPGDFPAATSPCVPIGDKVTGTQATYRSGLGAIDPVSGRAISKYNYSIKAQTGYAGPNIEWNAHQRPTAGGFALLATPQGLWAGSDGTKINNENHLGLAFLPQ